MILFRNSTFIVCHNVGHASAVPPLAASRQDNHDAEVTYASSSLTGDYPPHGDGESASEYVPAQKVTHFLVFPELAANSEGETVSSCQEHVKLRWMEITNKKPSTTLRTIATGYYSRRISFEFEFCPRRNCFTRKQFVFVCSEFTHTQCDFTFTHVL